MKQQRTLRELLDKADKEKSKLNIRLQGALLTPQDVQHELQGLRQENAELKRRTADVAAPDAASKAV